MFELESGRHAQAFCNTQFADHLPILSQIGKAVRVRKQFLDEIHLLYNNRGAADADPLRPFTWHFLLPRSRRSGFPFQPRARSQSPEASIHLAVGLNLPSSGIIKTSEIIDGLLTT